MHAYTFTGQEMVERWPNIQSFRWNKIICTVPGREKSRETSEDADQPSKWSVHKIVPDSKDTFELFIHHTEILEELYVLREEARQYCEQLSEDLRWKSNKKW